MPIPWKLDLREIPDVHSALNIPPNMPRGIWETLERNEEDIYHHYLLPWKLAYEKSYDLNIRYWSEVDQLRHKVKALENQLSSVKHMRGVTVSNVGDLASLKEGSSEVHRRSAYEYMNEGRD
jgi:hypothetical protein